MNSVRGNGLPPKTASPTATISITQDEILVMLIPHCDLQVKFSASFEGCQRGPRLTFSCPKLVLRPDTAGYYLTVPIQVAFG